MTMIHKKDDKSDPNNYRPISLTSCIGKLIERVINKRLYNYIESKNLLVPQQSGFRRKRRCADNLLLITQKVKELTDSKIVITEGALYPLLHQLEAEGVVTTETVNIGKRIRKYYTLTQTGNERAKEKIYEFADFIQTMNILLDLKPSV